MNKAIVLTLVILLLKSCGKNDKKLTSFIKEESIALSDSLDAIIAAPNSHEVVLENEEVRVLRVRIRPSEKEPMHTHKWKSVMIVEHPSRIRYYDHDTILITESKKEGFNYKPRKARWMNPEGPHAVENIDTIEYSAIRIEIKSNN